eukprot:g44765.t1
MGKEAKKPKVEEFPVRMKKKTIKKIKEIKKQRKLLGDPLVPPRSPADKPPKPKKDKNHEIEKGNKASAPAAGVYPKLEQIEENKDQVMDDILLVVAIRDHPPPYNNPQSPQLPALGTSSYLASSLGIEGVLSRNRTTTMRDHTPDCDSE